MTWLLLAAAAAPGLAAEDPADQAGWDLDPAELVRVDEPDHPEAIATSAAGSLLLAPPSDGGPWRPEAVAELDAVTAWEALDALRVDPWHEAGVDGSYADGSGVKVAVFDVQWFGAELRDLGIYEELAPAGTWDCFAHTGCGLPMDTLRPRFSWEEGGHGTACAEVIRDIAPGVELHLVRVNGQTTLENAVAWAVREGIDLVSMSLSFFNQSFGDGTGPIDDLMEVLEAGDTLMVTSAGNYAEEHWLEELRDRDLDGRHEFGGVHDGAEALPVWLEAGTRRISLSWNDFLSCGRTDLDLYVYDEDGLLVGRSTGVQEATEGCTPVERARVSVARDGWYQVVVHRAAGRSDVAFRIFARGGEVLDARPGGSIADPGNHPGVLTVGAVRARNYLENGPESFSSHGPTFAGLPKPELAGPDGLTTTVYGPTGFYGTSAATPAVVGAIALIMSEEPGLRPREAAARLVDAAWTDDALWEERDAALGAGHARLPPPGGGASGCGGGGASALLLALPLAGLQSLRRRRTRGDTLRRDADALRRS